MKRSFYDGQKKDLTTTFQLSPGKNVYQKVS